MGSIHTSILGDAHGYTREDVPWEFGEERSARGKLFHYLSGGGTRSCGRTIGQQKARRRHLRFYFAFAAFCALWTFFYLF